jgi:3-carboxy-cis,cis-muconate cycloisomerase
VERDAAGRERDGVLRLLSAGQARYLGLELNFSDERCAELLSDERLLAAMARFEAALARASAKHGIVAAADAESIARVCEAARFDAKALAAAARNAGTLAIPFVKALTEQVAAVSAEAARYVHFGATSQDVIDSAVVLRIEPACERVLQLAARVGDAAAMLARTHAQTPTVARTLLQPAVPVPFGWKAAVWLSMLARSYRGFRDAAHEACVLQFGGAGGTLAAFGGKGEAVAASLSQELRLRRSVATWHSARDGFARLGSEIAILAGAAGKIARDISLLMQPEIGEVAEPTAAGRGGSSALPHKRNPALSLLALEAAQRAPGLASTLLAQLTPEHERGLGQWQSQWFALRELICAAGSGLGAMAEALEGLTVNAEAMRANLERTRGLVFSEAVSVRLSRALGKAAAHALTEELCARAVGEGKTLQEILIAEPRAAKVIPAAERAGLFDPQGSFGAAATMIECSLADWAQTRATSRGTAP